MNIKTKNIEIIKNGLLTGMFLQLAIGPVFFFIINLVLQKTIFDGFAGVFAVTVVDYLYIILAIIGVGKLLEHKKFKTTFGIISSIVLIIFGLLIIKKVITNDLTNNIIINSTNIFSSFFSVFLITISSPMTIIFFTSIFTTKAIEYNYTKKQLYIFAISVGLATFLFMSTSVLISYFFKDVIPISIIQILNMIIGLVLIGYGVLRILKNFRIEKLNLT